MQNFAAERRDQFLKKADTSGARIMEDVMGALVDGLMVPPIEKDIVRYLAHCAAPITASTTNTETASYGGVGIGMLHGRPSYGPPRPPF